MGSETISVKEARRNFAKILKSAEEGEETTITKNGRAVARIVPPKKRRILDLDELSKFRESLNIKSLSVNGVLLDREEARY